MPHMMHDQDLSLARSDTSSTHSTATAPDLVGPGRTVGLLFEWLGRGLESFLNKRAIQLNLGPEAVARDIRRMRRRKEASLLSQYAAPYAYVTKSQEKKLRKLCKSLLKFARSEVRSTQFKALDEITSLAIEDQVIRDALRSCNAGNLILNFKEPELFVKMSRAKISVENVETHGLWSCFCVRLEHIRRHYVISRREVPHFHRKEMASLVEPLKKSLSNSTSSFLAARYFARIGTDFFNVREAHHGDLLMTYMDLLTASPEAIEWSSLNECGPLAFLCDDFYRLDVVKALLKHSASLRKFFSDGFSICELFYCIEDSAGERSGSFIFSDRPEGGFEGADSILVPNFSHITLDFEYLFEAAIGRSTNDYPSQITYLQRQNPHIQKALKNIFLGDERILVFLRIVRYLKEECGIPRTGCKCLDLCYGHTPIRVGDADCGDFGCPLHAISVLHSYSKNKEPEDRAFSTFLMSVIYSANRYIKHALNQAALSPIHYSERTLEYASSFVPRHGWLSEAFVEIWRIQVKGSLGYQFIIKGFDSFESYSCSERVSFDWYSDISQIDVMEIGYRNASVMAIPHTNTKVPFSVTGHFPIVAFQRDPDPPTYIAIVTGEEGYDAVATIKDGDYDAIYYDKHGVGHSTYDFKISVLRHDPVDFARAVHGFYEVFSKPRAGSLDNTGPVCWFLFFPQKHKDPYDDTPEDPDEERNFIPDILKEVLTSGYGRGDLIPQISTEEDSESISSEDPYVNVEFSSIAGSFRGHTETDDELESVIPEGPPPSTIFGSGDEISRELGSEASQSESTGPRMSRLSNVSSALNTTELRDELEVREDTAADRKETPGVEEAEAADSHSPELERLAERLRRAEAALAGRELEIERKDLEIARLQSILMKKDIGPEE